MKIAPSLLSADFANLASELKDIEKAGYGYLIEEYFAEEEE